MSDLKRDLLGRVVTSCVLLPGEDNLRIEAGGLVFQYTVQGDCCSISWIEHMEGVENLIGQEVIDVEQLSEDGEDRKDCCERCKDSDCLEVTQILIKTKKGTATLEFRNDSNGYYGGYLVGGKIGELV